MAIWAEIKKALNSTLGTSSFKSLDTLLTSAITSARDNINTNVNTTKTYAQNSQNYTATNNTGSKTGILSQKLTYLISLLENSTYGLSAIKNKLSGSPSTICGTANTQNNGIISQTLLNVEGSGIVQFLSMYTNKGGYNYKMYEIYIDGVKVTPNSTPYTNANELRVSIPFIMDNQSGKVYLTEVNESANVTGVNPIYFSKSFKVIIRYESTGYTYQTVYCDYLITKK